MTKQQTQETHSGSDVFNPQQMERVHKLMLLLRRHGINEIRLLGMVDSLSDLICRTTLWRDPDLNEFDSEDLNLHLSNAVKIKNLLNDLRDICYLEEMEKGATNG